MNLRTLLLRITLSILPLAAISCAAQGGESLKPGMTPGQAIQAMGQPDLRDSVPDPDHSGATVLRYIWLDQGKSAIFSSSDKIASIKDVDSGSKQKMEQQEAQTAQTHFDPIQTPLDYLFFPVKAGATYVGAGLNCVTGGSCHKPAVPMPGA
ncbi:MAG TPA: hypothetical protein VMU16_15085 [Candidatus Binataceae bacterium]|nr:hypothetical protein [Candidatus Binataceae bacterium]